ENSDKSVIELQQYARKNKPNLHILNKLQEEMTKLAKERTCCLFGNISAEEPSESSRSVELASRALSASISRSLLPRLALAAPASRALYASSAEKTISMWGVCGKRSTAMQRAGRNDGRDVNMVVVVVVVKVMGRTQACSGRVHDGVRLGRDQSVEDLGEHVLRLPTVELHVGQP
ncbi:hypothetical protein CRUP_004449, partial [Coryphaenoides rupestris]